jgi:hypothetical protein
MSSNLYNLKLVNMLCMLCNLFSKRTALHLWTLCHAVHCSKTQHISVLHVVNCKHALLLEIDWRCPLLYCTTVLYRCPNNSYLAVTDTQLVELVAHDTAINYVVVRQAMPLSVISKLRFRCMHMILTTIHQLQFWHPLCYTNCHSAKRC